MKSLFLVVNFNKIYANLPVPLVFLWISGGRRIRLKRHLSQPEASPQCLLKAGESLQEIFPLESTEHWPNEFAS